MIAEPIAAIAQELLASHESIRIQTMGRRLVAHAESVRELERDYDKLMSAAKAVVERQRGAVDELVALANHVERRPVLPVDGATP